MPHNRDQAIDLVRQVCSLAGSKDYLGTLRRNGRRTGLVEAIKSHNTAALFDHLMHSFSYQGISDSISDAYIEAHGNASWAELRQLMTERPGKCPRLLSFRTYRGCDYRKLGQSCAEPSHLPACPVPIPTLRKGALNQLAASLYLFLRDECEYDLVAYIDRLIASGSPDEARLRLAVAFGQVHAVSSKLINMALSDLLLLGGRSRPSWREVGLGMIAIDSLVHNFLHRAGILEVFDRKHAYGAACHGPKGCSEIIREISAAIDARAFNPTYPANFPRFVQHAIWSFCAEQGLGICNGRKIDDRSACAQTTCPVWAGCRRVPLKRLEEGEEVARKGPGRLMDLPTPFRQGDLDGLCGVYAVVNAVRLVLQTHGRIRRELYNDFYQQLVDEVDRLYGFGKVSQDGMSTREIGRLLRQASTVARSCLGYDLEIRRPLLSRRRQSIKRAVDHLSLELKLPGTALLLGLEGKYSHWTVAHRITRTFILLHDSAGFKRLSIRDCRMAHEAGSNDRFNLIGSGSAFVIRAYGR